MPSVTIYLHFPFDTGLFVGNDEKSTEGLVAILNENLKGNSVEVSRRPLYLVGQEADSDEIGSKFFQVPINVTLSVLTPYKGPVGSGANIKLVEGDINLFDTGVGVAHLKFLAELEKIEPKSVYEVYIRMTEQLEPIWNGESGRTDFSTVLLDVINALTKSVEEFGKAHSKVRRSEVHPIEYIYPLFSLGDNVGLSQISDFLCLLYHRPDKNDILPEELVRAKSSNCLVVNDSYFISKWEASLTGGGGIIARVADSNERILEVASYTWYSMYVVDSYMSKKIARLHSVRQGKPTLSESLRDLSEMRSVRVETGNLLDVYKNIRVSLWGSTVKVFEKIIDEWKFDRIESSINHKASMLSSIHNDTVDEIERYYNLEMNRTLFALQWIGYSLAVMIAILPYVVSAVNISLSSNILRSAGLPGVIVSALTLGSANLGVALIVVAITWGSSYYLQSRQWERLKRKQKYI